LKLAGQKYGEKMKVLETRNRKGIKWRRYRGDNGELLTSLEIPEEIVKKLIRKPDLLQAMQEYQSSIEILAWKNKHLGDENG
jgi:hypothetical protein